MHGGGAAETAKKEQTHPPAVFESDDLLQVLDSRPTWSMTSGGGALRLGGTILEREARRRKVRFVRIQRAICHRSCVLCNELCNNRWLG